MTRRFLSYHLNNCVERTFTGSAPTPALTFVLEKDKLRFMFMPKKIGAVIDQVASHTVGKDWPLYAALLEHWQEIVGTEYARVTTPVKITFPHQPQKSQRSHGLLSIRLPQGLAMEFSFKTEQIKQRINNYFGYEAFARIVFEPAHIAPPTSVLPEPIIPESVHLEIEKSLKDIPQGELREALGHFGQTLMSVKKPSSAS